MICHGNIDRMEVQRDLYFQVAAGAVLDYDCRENYDDTVQATVQEHCPTYGNFLRFKARLNKAGNF